MLKFGVFLEASRLAFETCYVVFFSRVFFWLPTQYENNNIIIIVSTTAFTVPTWYYLDATLKKSLEHVFNGDILGLEILPFHYKIST